MLAATHTTPSKSRKPPKNTKEHKNKKVIYGGKLREESWEKLLLYKLA